MFNTNGKMKWTLFTLKNGDVKATDNFLPEINFKSLSVIFSIPWATFFIQLQLKNKSFKTINVLKMKSWTEI